jgi:predicted sugar kinase
MTEREQTKVREYDPARSYKSAADIQREIDLIRWHSIQRLEAENRVDRWIGLGILLVGLLAVAAIIHTILLYV